jgi:hypothetical protein
VCDFDVVINVLLLLTWCSLVSLFSVVVVSFVAFSFCLVLRGYVLFLPSSFFATL